ncbi:MAG: phosphate ABC transporter permease PstA [Oscillospiraceae bacterium]|nr:phosphate ABC transporter permease PstA [Oscillospiraceae bacterium]
MNNDSPYKRTVHMDTVIIRTLACLAAGIALLILFGIIGYIFFQGLPAINWAFLSTEPSFLDQTYGIAPMIINTVYITVLALLIILPIGIGGAIYLSEYSKQGKILSLIRFTIEILSGIPSIVYGLFGALFFVLFFNMGYSILAGAFTLALIVLPIVVRTTEESLKSVDPTYREAALSMGVNKLYTIRTILLPCAMPGIIAAIILSVGRMVGESAALLCTSGTAYQLPGDIATHYKNSGATLAVQIYQCFTERPPGMTDATPFAIAAILMLVVLLLNFLTYIVGKGIKRG